MSRSAYRLLGVFLVSAVLNLIGGLAWTDQGDNSANRFFPTAYESHAGLFVKDGSSLKPEEPLLRDNGAVSRPLFKMVDRADNMVGKTFHTKIYRYGTEESFITTEDTDGAKMGFDF